MSARAAACNRSGRPGTGDLHDTGDQVLVGGAHHLLRAVHAHSTVCTTTGVLSWPIILTIYSMHGLRNFATTKVHTLYPVALADLIDAITLTPSILEQCHMGVSIRLNSTRMPMQAKRALCAQPGFLCNPLKTLLGNMLVCGAAPNGSDMDSTGSPMLGCQCPGGGPTPGCATHPGPQKLLACSV